MLLLITGAEGAMVARAQTTPLKGTLQASIVAPPNVSPGISKSEALDIAHVVVTGGVAGESISPFQHGLRLVLEFQDPLVKLASIRPEIYRSYIVIAGTDTKVGTAYPLIIDLSGGRYEIRYTMNASAAYTAAGQTPGVRYAIRYRSDELPSGLPVTLRLLDGTAAYAPKKFSHYISTDGNDRLRNLTGYQLTYDATRMAHTAPVVLGPAYQTIKDRLQSVYGISVLDGDRSSLFAMQIIQKALDTIGLPLFPKNLTGLRMSGYTVGTPTGSIGLHPFNQADPQTFGTVLMHELQHQVESHMSRCTQRDASRCRHMQADGSLTPAGQVLESLFKRLAVIKERAKSDAKNYLRTEITLETYEGTGLITAAPTLIDGTNDYWPAQITPMDWDNSLYRTKPTLTFTSGPYIGKQVMVGDSASGGIEVMRNPEKLSPPAGSTFSLKGDGADFFVIYPQEFYASISNNWDVDTRAAWQRCLAAYKSNRTLVLDQCLLYADAYALGRDQIPLFKQESDGTYTITMTPVIKENNRIVSIPALGPEHFAFDAEGLTKSSVVLGDMNNDNKVTASDALAALRVATGALTTTGTNGDVNCSGTITASDALIILKASVGSIATPLTCAASTVPNVPEITITKTGTGSGTVEPTALTTVGTETSFGFKATPSLGSVFVGWSGPCRGTAECRFTTTGMTPITLSARFDRITVVAAIAALGTFATTPVAGLLSSLLLLVVAAGLYYRYRPS